MQQQENASTLQIKGKVLFSGDNVHMVENLLSFVPREYDVFRCNPTEADFTDALEKHMPHTVIICLAEDSRYLPQTYIILQNSVKYLDLPVILVAGNEDYEAFKAKVFVKNLVQFQRPINTNKFQEQLHDNVSYYIDVYARPFALAQAQKAAEQAEKAALQTTRGEKNVAENKTAGKLSEADIEKKIEQLSRKEILVVDDDVRMLSVIKLYLQDLYSVTVVPSGKLALKFLSKKKADLVLLDYLMPDMMGPEVLKEIRTSSPQPKVPVVFLTGVSDKELVMRSLEYSPNGYLLKPIAREALLERVTEILLGL